MSDMVGPARHGGPDERGRRLESWKEIAAYLDRDVTTAQRWERREGLPVRRLHHAKLGSVYAYTAELETWRHGRAHPKGGPPAPESSPAVEAPGVMPTTRKRPRLGLLFALSVIAAGTLAAWVWAARGTAPISASATPSTTPIMSLPGQKWHPTVSPDGRHVVFGWDRDGHSDLAIALVEGDTNATIQLTQAPGTELFPSWSRDSRAIAFMRRSRSDRAQVTDAIHLISALGGTERVIWDDETERLGSGLDWLADNEHVVLCVQSANDRPYRLAELSLTTRERRWLTDPPATSVGDSFPVVSPDGHRIAFVRDTGAGYEIHVMNIAASESRRLMISSSEIARLAWMRDGQSIVFMAYGGMNDPELQRVHLSSGHVGPLAAVGRGARDPSIAGETGRLVFMQVTLDTNLYRAELTVPTRVIPLAHSSRSDTQPDVSPDGTRIAFVSDRNGHAEIWTMGALGNGLAMLTDLRGACRHPRWSPDGRSIVFSCRETGVSHPDLYVINSSGGPTRQITGGRATDQWPTWSRDGRGIYFASDRSGPFNIWKVPASGGSPVQKTQSGGLKAWESDDGRSLIYSTDVGYWQEPVEGGKPSLLFEHPGHVDWGGEWLAARPGLYWLNRHASPRVAIELFDLATRHSQTILTPPGEYEDGSGFSISPNGDWLVFAQRDYSGSELMRLDSVR